MRLTVLLISAGGFQGQGLVQVARSIGDVRVVVADSISLNIGLVIADRYVMVPPLTEHTLFANAIEDLVRTEHIDIVFPSTDRELHALAHLRPQLEAAGAKVAVSALPLLQLLADKRATYQRLLLEGIPSQQPQTPGSSSCYPLLGKPRNGWGGRGFEIIRQWSDLTSANLTQRLDDFCWVPLLEAFDEFSADFAIGFSGEVSPITLRRRLRTSSGFSVVSDSVEDPAILAICAKVAGWLSTHGGCGVFNVQVLRLPDATCYVSDINARHGTSSGHAMAEGNNLVGFMLGIRASSAKRVRTVRLLEQRAIPIPLAGQLPYRGVAFDLDDTLIDHKRWIVEKMHLASMTLSAEVPQADLMEAAYAVVEEGDYERLIDRIVDRMNLPRLRDRLLEAYRSAVPAIAPVFEDVHDALLALRRANIRIGLITDNPPESQKAKLASMKHVSSLLDAVVFTREHGEEKPSTGGFIRLAEMLELPPSSLLMVGDNVARDAVGAISAGYAACMLLNRPGGRFHVHEGLLTTCLPRIASRTWISPDLRTLTTACGVAA